MNKNIKNIALFSFALALCGCTPDRGTYDYEPLNEVEISGIEESYDVNRFNELNIPVDVKFSKTGEEFEYLWYMYSIGESKIDTLSHSKDLKYKFSNLPNKYDVVFKVIDKKRGVYFHKNTEISVINTINEGFMYLGSVTDKDSLNISMVNASGVLSMDMYKSMNGMFLTAKPEKIFHFIPSNGGAFKNQEYITVTYDGGKAYQFDPINFVKVMTEKDMFILFPNQIRIDGYNTNYSYADILINNGKIHTRRYVLAYDAEVEADDKGYTVGGISLSNSSFLCFYDTQNRRFITLNNSKTKVATMNLARKSKPFPVDDVNMDLVAAQCSGAGFSKAIMRDDAKQLVLLDYILRYDRTTEETTMQFVKQKTLETSLKMYDADKFVFSGENANSVVYFKKGDTKLYHYEFGNAVESVALDLAAVNSTFVIENVHYYNEQLTVAFRDTASALERKCGVIIYDVVAESGNIQLTEKFRHNNIANSIVDITYKINTFK